MANFIVPLNVRAGVGRFLLTVTSSSTTSQTKSVVGLLKLLPLQYAADLLRPQITKTLDALMVFSVSVVSLPSSYPVFAY